MKCFKILFVTGWMLALAGCGTPGWSQTVDPVGGVVNGSAFVVKTAIEVPFNLLRGIFHPGGLHAGRNAVEGAAVGAAAGSFGFIAGPAVGVATISTGAGLGFLVGNAKDNREAALARSSR